MGKIGSTWFVNDPLLRSSDLATQITKKDELPELVKRQNWAQATHNGAKLFTNTYINNVSWKV